MEIFVIAEHYDYSGCELPTECFRKYENAVERLHQIAKQRRRKVSKHNVVNIAAGTIEIETLTVADAE